MIWKIARCVGTTFSHTYDKIILLDFDGVLCPIVNADNGRVNLVIFQYNIYRETKCVNRGNWDSHRRYIPLATILSLWQLQRM